MPRSRLNATGDIPAYVQRRKLGEHRERQRQQQEDKVAQEGRQLESHLAIIRALDHISEQLAIDEQQEQRDHSKRAFREWTTIVLLVATVVAAGTGDVFFYGQLSEMKASTGQTEKLVAAANTQAEAAKQSIVAATRAWLGPLDANLSSAPAAGNELSGTISYQNTGKEPARDGANDNDFYVSTIEEDKNGELGQRIANYVVRCAALKERVSGGVTYPITGLGGGSLSFKFPKELIDADVVGGEKILMIQGCFVYRTAGVVRHSAYCYYFKSGLTNIQHLNICGGGNYAD